MSQQPQTAMHTGPITKIVAVTPHDTDPLTVPARSVWVGTSGTLVVKLRNDSSTVTLHNVAAGVWHPMAPLLITTASTAGNIRVGY
jgi:hypothetical protein